MPKLMSNTGAAQTRSADRVPVQLVFNAAGAPAGAGRIIRAMLVIAASVTLVLAMLAGLSRARAGYADHALLSDPVISLAIARHQAASASTACLPASIKAALARAHAACGIRVISTLRPGARIAGTNHISMHASCRAADFTSANYACVYRVLAGWPGKLSIDAARMRHVHIDDGRYARFVHGGHHRYAKRHKGHRFARRAGRQG